MSDAPLSQRIADARAELERLEREVNTATCADVGHDWRCLGGKHCGCDPDAICSVPVHECTRCGACDYGDNEWADEQRRECEEFYQ